MSLCENVSELARELRTAAGTVLTIVGSRLEADARAQEAREVIDPGECTCQPCPLRDEDVCDEAEADEDYLFTTTWAEYNAKKPEGPECVNLCGRSFPCGPTSTCGCAQDYASRHLHPSAATPDAADPSPADNHHASRGAGDEGRKEDSGILQSASFRQPTCIRCDQRIGEAALVADKGGYWCSVTCAQLDQESDPGAVTSPAPGGQVREDDLAAHITAIQSAWLRRGGPRSASFEPVSVADEIANSLLADFNITKK